MPLICDSAAPGASTLCGTLRTIVVARLLVDVYSQLRMYNANENTTIMIGLDCAGP